MSEVGVFSFLLSAEKEEFLDFPPVRAKSTRNSHAVLTRSLGQLVFCADMRRRAHGTSTDKESLKVTLTSRGGRRGRVVGVSCSYQQLTGLHDHLIIVFLVLQAVHRAPQPTSEKLVPT